MPKGEGSLTPFTALTETRVLTFDFGSLWGKSQPDLTITSVASLTCAVAEDSPVNDPFPPARLIGLNAITASPTTLNGYQAVAQQVGNLLPGVIYIVTCTVTVSDSSRATLWNYLTTDSNQ